MKPSGILMSLLANLENSSLLMETPLVRFFPLLLQYIGLTIHVAGYGYHGDFMMGWDQAFLQSAVNTCTNLSGQISDCALFTIQDESVYGNCNITVPAAIAKENVVGPVSTIPGNPVIASGPGYADGATAGGATTTVANVAPTLSYSAGVSLGSSDTYVPGAIFAVSTKAAEAVASTSSPVIAAAAAVEQVTTPAPSPTPTDTRSYFTTEYSTSGQAVIEILWVETEVTITASETTTIYAKNKRHLHKHRRGERA
jgi:hypothetical protein